MQMLPMPPDTSCNVVYTRSSVTLCLFFLNVMVLCLGCSISHATHLISPKGELLHGLQIHFFSGKSLSTLITMAYSFALNDSAL